MVAVLVTKKYVYEFLTHFN